MGVIVVGSLILGADDKIAEYVRRKVGLPKPFKDFVAFGVVRRGVPCGGVVFHNYRDCDIEAVAAFDDPTWALPGTLRGLFAYPFEQLGCARMTCIIERKNKRSRKFIEGLGFKLEGVIRKAFDGKQDAMFYGLLREECRWLRKDNGQEKNTNRTAAA